MSRIAKAIRVVNTGVHTPIRRHVRLSASDRFESGANVTTRYRISLTCAATAEIADGSGDAFEAGTRLAKQAVVREVFGEFYDPIQEIRMALLNDDCQLAEELLSELQRSMFSLDE